MTQHDAFRFFLILSACTDLHETPRFWKTSDGRYWFELKAPSLTLVFHAETFEDLIHKTLRYFRYT
jgi:hypothetical protein